MDKRRCQYPTSITSGTPGTSLELDLCVPFVLVTVLVIVVVIVVVRIIMIALVPIALLVVAIVRGFG